MQYIAQVAFKTVKARLFLPNSLDAAEIQNGKTKEDALNSALQYVKTQTFPFENDCLFAALLLLQELNSCFATHLVNAKILQTPNLPTDYNDYDSRIDAIAKVGDSMKAQYELAAFDAKKQQVTIVGGVFVDKHDIKTDHFAVFVTYEMLQECCYLDPTLLKYDLCAAFNALVAVKYAKKDILVTAKPMAVVMTPKENAICALKPCNTDTSALKVMQELFEKKILTFGTKEI